jgi:hypothetical protein
MENLKIKITGEGSRTDVHSALVLIAKALETTPIEELDGSEWEDCTLLTEIESEDLEPCEGCEEIIPVSDLYCNNCGNENF